MITVWGLKNCDRCRAALKWLQENGIAYSFRDIRQDGPGEGRLGVWLEKTGSDLLINRRSTTWRSLSGKDKDTLGGQNAGNFLLEHPTLIKRPVIEAGDTVLIGFSQDVKKALISSGR